MRPARRVTPVRAARPALQARAAQPVQSGPSGPTGPSGTATTTVVLASGITSTTVTATCASGTHAVAGGFTPSGVLNVALDSFPSDAAGTPAANATTNPTSWTGIFRTGSASNQVWVVCVSN